MQLGDIHGKQPEQLGEGSEQIRSFTPSLSKLDSKLRELAKIIPVAAGAEINLHIITSARDLSASKETPSHEAAKTDSVFRDVDSSRVTLGRLFSEIINDLDTLNLHGIDKQEKNQLHQILDSFIAVKTSLGQYKKEIAPLVEEDITSAVFNSKYSALESINALIEELEKAKDSKTDTFLLRGSVLENEAGHRKNVKSHEGMTFEVDNSIYTVSPEFVTDLQRGVYVNGRKGATSYDPEIKKEKIENIISQLKENGVTPHVIEKIFFNCSQRASEPLALRIQTYALEKYPDRDSIFCKNTPRFEILSEKGQPPQVVLTLDFKIFDAGELLESGKGVMTLFNLANQDPNQIDAVGYIKHQA